MDKLVSELYLIRQYEKQFATKLRPIMHDLGAFRAEDGVSVIDSDWEPKKHIWRMNYNTSSKRRNEVVFSQHRYDPTMSEIVYGKAAVIEEDNVKVDGFAKTFDNRGVDFDTQEEISQKVTLTRSVQHSFAQEYSFSMSSETQVSGSYGGVEFQQTLTASFGTKFDTTDTESESTDVEETVSHAVTVPAKKRIIVSFEKNKMITETPFDVNGYLDFKIWLNFENWASGNVKQGALLFGGWHYGKKTFTFNSILEFERFLKGYDVEYPRMAKYESVASSKATKAMAWLFNKKNRIIKASGTKRREFENNVNIITQEA